MVVLSPTERARPAWLREHPRAWLAAVGAVCFGAFLGQLDASIVAMTYARIGTDFSAGLGAVQVVSLTYLLALAMLLLPVGRLSDRLGRKRVYLWGFALFTAASAGCAGAPSLATLAACRAVQGAGAAMLQANSVAIVATSAPAHRLRAALGMQAAAQAVGLAAGPTVGGLLVQTFGWRAVFALNVPVGIAGLLAGRYLLPRTRLSREPGRGLSHVLRTAGMARGLVGALLGYLVLFGPVVLVPSLLQAAGTGPFAAGLLVAALPLGFAAGALAGRRVLPEGWPDRRQALLGVAVAAAGVASLLFATSADRGTWLVGLTLCGLGLGVFTPANNAQVMAAAPASRAATAGGLVSASRALGTATATAVVAATIPLAANGRAAILALLGCLALLAVSCGRRDRGRPTRARCPAVPPAASSPGC